MMSQSEPNSSEFVSGKEPWLAVNLSMFFPGIGQIYAGNVYRGLFFISLYILLACRGLWLLINPSFNITTVGLILIIAVITVFIGSLFDAHRCAVKANSPSFEELRKSGKDPWLAVFLTRIVLGLGHLYIKKLFLGIFLVTVVIFSYFIRSIAVGYLVGLILAILLPFVAYNAYGATPAQRTLPKKPILIVSILLILIPLLVSVPTAFFVREFVAEARYIPSGSMLPTLQIDDRLLIDKWSYRFQSPQRGDIVLFSPTEALKQRNFKDAFIARVIGLPDEKVEVKDGLVYINAQALQENYIEEKPDYRFGPVTVPLNEYFVLGDNRNNSYDSHYWGFVPRENIIGKATQRFWSPDRSGPIE